MYVSSRPRPPWEKQTEKIKSGRMPPPREVTPDGAPRKSTATNAPWRKDPMMTRSGKMSSENQLEMTAADAQIRPFYAGDDDGRALESYDDDGTRVLYSVAGRPLRREPMTAAAERAAASNFKPWATSTYDM